MIKFLADAMVKVLEARTEVTREEAHSIQTSLCWAAAAYSLAPQPQCDTTGLMVIFLFFSFSLYIYHKANRVHQNGNCRR